MVGLLVFLCFWCFSFSFSIKDGARVELQKAMQSDKTREVIFKSSFSKTTFWAAIFGPRTFIVSRSSWSDGISPDQVLSGVIGRASTLAATTTPSLKREFVFR